MMRQERKASTQPNPSQPSPSPPNPMQPNPSPPNLTQPNSIQFNPTQPNLTQPIPAQPDPTQTKRQDRQTPTEKTKIPPKPTEVAVVSKTTANPEAKGETGRQTQFQRSRESKNPKQTRGRKPKNQWRKSTSLLLSPRKGRHLLNSRENLQRK